MYGNATGALGAGGVLAATGAGDPTTVVIIATLTVGAGLLLLLRGRLLRAKTVGQNA